jgi:hypothetical protein
MRQRRKREILEAVTLLLPPNFEPAARYAAQRCKLPLTEYMRRALILRLEADGVRLDDFDKAA